MTTIDSTIQKIKRELIQTFALLDECFDSQHEILSQKPPGDKWSILEILEHVTLTNHYFLKLIGKASAQARRKAATINLTEALLHYQFDFPDPESVWAPGVFQWQRPAHLVPVSQKTADEIRGELRWQLYQCLQFLSDLGNGEGILQRTTLMVNNMEKLDVYQYIYFLALHAQRHLRQIDEDEKLLTYS